MPTPAEKYAAARRRGAHEKSQLASFAAGYSFAFDDFQLRACAAVQAGDGVLVAAPTGAGKTIVGEFAVHLALATGRKAFYTTPIKALSNQKHADLARRHGSDRVGLLTGDASINGEASVVVMTTEVLRNMLYAGSPTLDGLGFVVMDEVHYLADRLRGAVWEEVIIHLPESVQVVSLSATVSNAEEFGAWLSQVRGATEVVVEERRPVPLWQHMMVGRSLHDLFADEADHEPVPPTAAPAQPQRGRGKNRKQAASAPRGGPRLNPELLDAIASWQRGTDRRGKRLDAGAPRGRRGRPRGNHLPSALAEGGLTEVVKPRGRDSAMVRRPTRADVVDRLGREGLLPAIVFIFSRVGCDAAVSQLLSRGTRLICDEDGERIRQLVTTRMSAIPPDDLAVLGYWDFLDGLTRGFAAHHAGMLPTFREVVEELFVQGRLQAVFATETLALGINMPARTVVLEKLVKFNGESHADITPAEYTQLTGRAGRRGIDVEGHGVVMWHPHLDPVAVAGLASTRTYPLNSSFRPTYNMAVNLVARVNRTRAAAVLETSFAQFQADRAVVGLSTAIQRNEEALAGYAESMSCHLGDFAEYARLRARISELEKGVARTRSAKRRAEVSSSLERLRPGDVVWLEADHHPGPAIVLSKHAAGRGAIRSEVTVPVLTHEARHRRLGTAEVDQPLEAVLWLPLPRRFDSRNARARRDLAATLRAKLPDPPTGHHHKRGRSRSPDTDLTARVDALRRELRAHPCHRCPDREQHARWAERWWRLRKETDALRSRVQNRTHSVARTFERICDLLGELGYLDPDGQQVSEAGQMLRGIYAERDLLTAECLRHGAWQDLDPPSLAAAVSCLIHEPRREEATVAPRLPNEPVVRAVDLMASLWSDLEEREREHGLTPGNAPDAGIAGMVHRWASGSRLGLVLKDSDLAAGDFVRRCKQLVDLLAQISQVSSATPIAATAQAAAKAIMRGVVAADRLD